MTALFRRPNWVQRIPLYNARPLLSKGDRFITASGATNGINAPGELQGCSVVLYR